jgi:nicotinate-nucleotide adenylyltransferase
MGGSFDPPHFGHLIIAEEARCKLELDKVLFIPAFISPLKSDKEITPTEHRVRMTQLAIEDNPFFELETWELEQKQVSYTVDTLAMLHEKYKGSAFYLIIGDDNLAVFQRWRSPEKIKSLAHLVVFERDHKMEDLPPETNSISFLREVTVGISSTLLRQRLKRQKSIRYLCPDSVNTYIKEKKLYQSP